MLRRELMATWRVNLHMKMDGWQNITQYNNNFNVYRHWVQSFFSLVFCLMKDEKNDPLWPGSAQNIDQ